MEPNRERVPVPAQIRDDQAVECVQIIMLGSCDQGQFVHVYSTPANASAS